MNDQNRLPPQHSMSHESMHLALIAMVVIILLGGLDTLIVAICAGAVIVFCVFWDLPRIRATARAFADHILKD